MPIAKERILEALEQFDERICDDCLVIVAEVAPRQAVNQICRTLAIQRKIDRTKGDCQRCKDRKLVNKLGGPAESTVQSPRVIKDSVSEFRGNETIDGYLDGIRRRVIDVLICIDDLPRKGEGLSARILRLREANRLPGSVACMMLTLTGLRNLVVYEKFIPGRFELAVVEAAWSSIKEWQQTSRR